MDVTITRCCGLDVHQATITACALLDGQRRPRKVIRTFRTMRASIEELRNWLKSLGVTHVAFEGTGVYWMPVYEMLEGHFDISVVNARHVRQLPGRKTDVNDSQWLATLLRHGLLRKSFVPPKEIRALRDMTRYRRMLVQSATTEKNRILKLLEMAGIKLGSVATDVFGTSGMDMLRALAKGDVPLDDIVEMARSRLRRKQPELRLALDVLIDEHHRLMLRDQLARLDRTLEEIGRYDALLKERVAPYHEHLALLCSIDGVQSIAAIEIFAEVGPDLSSFPTDGHFSSWAGTCPGQHESAGKHRNARRRRGNPYIQAILVECALAATRKKGTYLKGKYHRLRARRGTMRALFAIAHKLCRAVYRVLTTRECHQDLGDAYLDRRNAKAVARNLVARLQRLGLDAAAVQDLFRPRPVPM
jgi:transposase